MEHPLIQAAGFTGSPKEEWRFITLRRAAFSRFHFAEMSSVNPVVVLPEALHSRGEQIAQDTVASLIWVWPVLYKTRSNFRCKGPEFDRFITALVENTQKAVPQVMLNEGTLKAIELVLMH